MNGFSFYSVGSGTILENLVAYKGAGWFRILLVEPSAKNFNSLLGNSDDSLTGKMDGGDANTNWLAYQVATGNYGMEAKSFNNAF
jgi:hypothetical protein